MLTCIENLKIKGLFVTDFCDYRWEKHDEFCYMFKKDAKPFDDAVKYCKNNGAEIVTITNQEENDFIKRELLYCYNQIKEVIYLN